MAGLACRRQAGPAASHHSTAPDRAHLAAGLRQRGQVLAVLPDAQLASEAGTYRPDKQGKAFAARMSDELEPLHRVRWSWQAPGPPGGPVDGKRACGSKLLAQQVHNYQMQAPVCEASALCLSRNECAGAKFAYCPCSCRTMHGVHAAQRLSLA